MPGKDLDTCKSQKIFPFVVYFDQVKIIKLDEYMIIWKADFFLMK